MNRLLLLSALALSLMGCDKDESTKPVVPTDASIAASLWTRMTNENYTVPGAQWGMFPGKAGIYAGDSTLLGSDPHLGPTHFRTFVNAAAHTALAANSFPLPDQSIIAKENFVASGPDTTLVAITVMLKRAGYDPANHDWFWVKYKPSGQAEEAGRIAMCIGCHGGASSLYGSERDYVWTRAE